MWNLWKKNSTITTTNNKHLHHLDEISGKESGTLSGTCRNLSVKCSQRLKEREEEPPCWDLNSTSQKTEKLVIRSCETQQVKLTFCTLYLTHYYLVFMLFPPIFLFPPITNIISVHLNIGPENPSDHPGVKSGNRRNSIDAKLA